MRDLLIISFLAGIVALVLLLVYVSVWAWVTL